MSLIWPPSPLAMFLVESSMFGLNSLPVFSSIMLGMSEYGIISLIVNLSPYEVAILSPTLISIEATSTTALMLLFLVIFTSNT
ncbi:hypothetical protein WAI453_013702 [Rhynchosporium graminicola]